MNSPTLTDTKKGVSLDVEWVNSDIHSKNVFYNSDTNLEQEDSYIEK